MIKRILKRLSKKHSLEDVFTPSTAATLTFVDRQEIEGQINKSLMMPGMQLIMYGHSGSGKTTIIQNILKKQERRYIVTNCILDTTIDQLLLEAFDKLNPYYTAEINKKETIKIGAEIKTSYLAIDSLLKSEFNYEESKKEQRIIPVQLTPQRLVDFLGAANAIWIIEDFHKVNKEERQKLSQILKVFVDASNKYKKIKVIAIGAVGTAREVVNYDSELNNRISEIFVPLLNREELEDIMFKGEKLLNFDFEQKIHDDIIKYSNSLGAICHHLCFSICYNNKILQTQKVKKRIRFKNLQEAVVDYLKQNSDSFKETLDRALKQRDGKFDNTKAILQTICKSEKDELTKKEILSHGKNKKAYPIQVLNEYLNLLTTAEYGEILRYDENSGKYSFSNPFFKAYTIMTFAQEEKESITTSIDFAKLEEIMKYLTISIDENIDIRISK
jgi:Holliday junction resolvasome RuvABC ATP-dependent DNA helicase subunit